MTTVTTIQDQRPLESERYIYAFTGFLQETQSDDEIAFVLGHEIGHSMLKHGLRQEEDPWMKIAKIAAAIGAARGGGSGETLAGVAASLQVQHSQADELEADAIGTAIAWRAGYDAIRGADFFTRSVRRADDMWSDADRQLEQLKTEALQSRSNCEQLLAGWNGGRVPRNPQNQQLVNAACAEAEQKPAGRAAVISQLRCRRSAGHGLSPPTAL